MREFLEGTTVVQPAQNEKLGISTGEQKLIDIMFNAKDASFMQANSISVKGINRDCVIIYLKNGIKFLVLGKFSDWKDKIKQAQNTL